MSERVLIIDDHFETLRLTSLVLQRQGYVVDTASSGSAGIDKARENVPNLVLLDIMMPEIDGLEVCRNFRSDDSLRNVPIMMFTARSDDEDMKEAYSAGANDYVVKPTRPQELVNRVKSALEKFANFEAEDASGDTKTSLPRIGIIDATSAEYNAGYLLASNLAIILQEKGHEITMFDLTDSAPPPIGSVVWHSFSPQETDQLAERLQLLGASNAVLVNLGRDSTTLPDINFTTLILVLTPDIASIMNAQNLLKTIGTPTPITNLMLDFSGSPSVTPEMATQFLQHDVKTIIPIDEEIIDRAKLLQVPFVETSEGTDIKTKLTDFITSHL